MNTLNYYTFTLIFMLISFGGFSQEDDAIPFAVVDQVPAYPGCENLEGKELKKCTVEKISSYVNVNFNTSLGKKFDVQGVSRIVVQFKIDDEGNITNVRSRSLDDKAEIREALQNEANRVVSSLPKMQPGQKDGKEVAIMYSLPIVFAIPQKGKQED